MELAPCGLDCGACPQKPAHCDGCHAEGDHRWHADCKIRVCCKFEKGLANCAECGSFPCQSIVDFEDDRWAHHTAAVQRLRAMRQTTD
jgi:hypothetical protein